MTRVAAHVRNNEKGASHMASKRGHEPIRVVQTTRGRRYRVVADAGVRVTVDGRTVRRQVTRTFDTRKEASAWLAEHRVAVKRDEFVARDRRTVDDLLTAWLASRRTIRPTTRACYETSLKSLRATLGGVAAQDVTRAEADALAARSLEAGRSPRTVRLMVNVARMAWAWAVQDGWCRHNPWERVEVPSQQRVEMRTWTREQLAAFLAAADEDEHAALWRLLALGLRRGEALALRWSDVQLDGDEPSLTVRRSRVLVERQVVEGEPKSSRSRRVLPLAGLPETVAVLRRVRADQARQRLALGLGSTEDGGFVVADALGRPVHPDNVTRWFRQVCSLADVPRLRVHDVRHTALTLLAEQAPIHVVSRWAGHADPSLTLRVYAHAQDDALRAAGSALAL